MLRDNRFRLVTLGRLTLVGEGGEEDTSLARRRLKLAVLAVLALARRPVPRDTLLGLFWAETDEARARHSLSNALSSLRRALGERAITTRDADVALDPETPLDVDALEFSDALERKDPGRAVELYEGPFLEGFHVDESPAFEQWVSRERRRLEALYTKACAEYCAVLARSRRWQECETVANRWLEVEPLSADAAIYFLNAIKSPGTRAALARSLAEFESLRARLNKEFELAPHPSVLELSDRIRTQLASAPPEPVVDVRVTAETKIEPLRTPPVPAPAAETPAVPDESTTTRPTPPAPAVAVATPVTPVPSVPHHTVTTTFSRKRAAALLGAAALAVLAFFAKDFLASGEVARPGARPVIAVMSFAMRLPDSSAAWLSDGLAQMIDGKLASVPQIETAAPARVRAVVRRSSRRTDAQFGEAEARDLARRVGATLVAHGTLARDEQNYVLDLFVRDVRTGVLVGSAVLTSGDPLVLADQAAARILAATNLTLGGPRLNIETTSLEAYQFYMRSMENGRAGRMAAAIRDIESSIALDSGFIPALRARISYAIGSNDTALVRKLRQTLDKHASRATEFDRMEQSMWDAYFLGEHERSEALARALVTRFPRDPRGYQLLRNVFSSHGKFEDAETVAIDAFALDSLALGAGTGPCDQCGGFFEIVSLHWANADWDGAARWARRWINVQPDAPSAWSSMAWTLSYAGQPDSALALQRRAVTLSGNELWTMEQYGRMLLVNRRYAEADSVVKRIESLHRATSKGEVADLRQLLAREHGRIRESTRIIDALTAASPDAAWFVNLIRADNLRLLGDYAGAFRYFERLSHGPPDNQASLPIEPPSARAYCWHHGLAADALGPSADTTLLRGITDTLSFGCHRSYYGRDWVLHHHARGLLAMRQGRYADAEREFAAAVWIRAESWGRTLVELAKARIAQGRAKEAVADLRVA